MPGARTSVDDRAVSAFTVTGLISETGSHTQEMSKHHFVTAGRFIKRFDVLTRHDQQVRWRLRINIANRDATLVLMDYGRGNFAGDDFAE